MTAATLESSQTATQPADDDFEEITIQPGQDPFRNSYTVISNALMDCDCKQHFDQPSHKFLLLTILRWYNIDVGKAWAGQETLANQTGLSTKTIQRAADGLEARGWIKIDRQWVDGKRHNTYKLTNKVFFIGQTPTKTSKTVSKTTQKQGEKYKTKQKTTTNKQKTYNNTQQQWQQTQEKRPKPPQWQGLQPIQKIEKHKFKQQITQTKTQLTALKTTDPIPI